VPVGCFESVPVVVLEVNAVSTRVHVIVSLRFAVHSCAEERTLSLLPLPVCHSLNSTKSPMHLFI